VARRRVGEWESVWDRERGRVIRGASGEPEQCSPLTALGLTSQESLKTSLPQLSPGGLATGGVASKVLLNFGTFHETAKVVNSLFGETWRTAEYGSTNCQLEFERCLNFLYAKTNFSAWTLDHFCL